MRAKECGRLELTQLNGVGTVPDVRFRIALVLENELVLPPSHHTWTLWGYVYFSSLMLDNLMLKLWYIMPSTL